MCGICGYWRPGDPLPDAPAIIDDMCAAIVHRGPDGQGSYVDPSVGLAMGHTRLAIIGLEDGQQPLVSRDGMTALTVNGEFYGYKRIRAELAADGERMRTATDSEIAIGLHRRLGREFVHRLRGEFAFALYDKREDELLLVRDRFGVRPLYVHINGDECIWGSEIKALLAHPRCPRELSRRAALHQLMQVMVPGETAFEGIQAVRPGQMLRIRREGGRLVARAETYWDMDFPLAGDHEGADEATAARFVEGTRDRLIDAVGVRLEADVPVGCYLSGGIDSCSILGLAAPQQQSPITAFTIAFDDDRYDESRIARDMARTVGARQIILHVDAARLYGDSFTSVVRHAERTFYNTLSVAKWQMSRRVREEGFKVVLTGEGSDELFGGYPFFKRDMFIHGGPDQAVHREAMERSNALFGGAILSEDAQRHPAFDDLCGFTPSWVQPWMETLQRARPLLSDGLREELAGYDPIEAIAAALDAERVRGRHPLDIAQYTWSKTQLEGQILTWGGDRVDMAHALESRPAFLDHLLAEYAVTIPPGLRIRDGVEKWVLREAVKGVLPDELYTREKFPFMAPPAHTDDAKARGLGALADEWLAPRRVAAAGIADPGAVAELVGGREGDAADANRDDILVNHLLGVHILSDMVEPAPA